MHDRKAVRVGMHPDRRVETVLTPAQDRNERR